jgi:hypothetical protein
MTDGRGHGPYGSAALARFAPLGAAGWTSRAPPGSAAAVTTAAGADPLGTPRA